GAKPAGRENKPRGAASAVAGKKSFSAGKPSGGKKPFADKPAPRDGKPVRAAKPAPAAPAAGADLAPERISKLLARAGVASRRAGATPRPARRPPPAAPAAGADLAPERISKLRARAGVASRRDVERMIMEGRIRVNGTVLDTPVLNATLADHIEVDGVPIRGI